MGLPRLTAVLVAGTLLGCADSGTEAPLLALRPDSPDPTEPKPVFAPDDVVHRHDSPAGAFRVHYTTRGQHAVPPADADADDVPDYVQMTALEYDRVLAFYVDALGFRAPLTDAPRDDASIDDGGDGRFDVYLLDFPTSADGAYRREACTIDTPARCAGYMLQENDFDRRSYPSLAKATRILASHELFHAVQSAYLGASSVVLGEATAVWASEAYDASLDDFEGFVGGYLARPDRSLGQEPIGPVDPFSYGAALFFRFLEETHGRDIVRRLWEALPSSPVGWPETLDAVLMREEGATLALAFATFARWNLQTGARAAPGRGYREAARYPAVAEKSVDLPFRDALVRMAPLSARYFVSTLTATSDLSANIIGLTHGVAQLEVVLAIERASRLLDLGHEIADRPHATVVAEAGDRVHTLLIDRRVAGPIRRVSLCIRSRDDASAPCAE